MNFWEKLKKPILALAPMADVTDAAFRYVIAKNSDIEHVTWTEFVSADGLARAPEEGRKKLLKDLEYSELERPIVAQFFTSNPAHMEKAAQLALELGFDGVDINMGCPDKSVEKQGAGAALMKDPKLARELIKAAKRGVEGKIPISVKTRLGYNKDELETLLPELLAEEPAVITIHARTRAEMSKVPARWERVVRAVQIRNAIQTSPPTPLLGKERGKRGEVFSYPTLIFGNGDVIGIDHARGLVAETGADGVMLGRAIFGNPFLFRKTPPTPEEKIRALIEHTNLFEQKFRAPLVNGKSFSVMKKHFKAYLSGLSGAKPLLENLIQSENAGQVEELLITYLHESLM